MKNIKKRMLAIAVIAAIVITGTVITGNIYAAANIFYADITVGSSNVSAKFEIMLNDEARLIQNDYSTKNLEGDMIIPNTVTNAVTGKEHTVTSINYGVFENCIGLTSTGLGGNSTIRTIESSAFQGCTGFKSTGLENNSTVTLIESRAFQGCTGLKSTGLEDNSTVTRITDNVFKDCIRLENTGLGGNSTITSIGSYAFEGCTGLESTGLESNTGLKRISDNLFRDCTGLTSTGLESNSTITSIGSSFTNCIKLKSTGLENNSTVTSIEMWAFDGCKGLTKVMIPEQITDIDSYAFDNCSNLDTFIFKGHQIPTIGNNPFETNMHIYYPEDATDINNLVGKGTDLLTAYKRVYTVTDNRLDYHAGDIYLGNDLKVKEQYITTDTQDIIFEENKTTADIEALLTLPSDQKLDGGVNTIQAEYDGTPVEFEVNASVHNPGEWIIDQEATEISTGLRHKICTICHETVVSEEIAKLPHVYSYKLLEGEDVYTMGTKKDITYKIDGDYSLFKGIQLDGKEISQENYTSYKGSTVLTLKSDYLESLTVGQHKINFIFNGHEVKTALTVKSVNTVKPSISEPQDTVNAPNNTDTPDKEINFHLNRTENGIIYDEFGNRVDKYGNIIQTSDQTSLFIYLGITILSGCVIIILKKKYQN